MKRAYKYIEHNDVWIKVNYHLESFENDWVKVEDNIIKVKGTNGNGYAWDGCSPKIIWLDLCIGTPDGKTILPSEKSITYYASMIHDAIYQIKKDVSLSRKDTDNLFKLLVKKENFFWWRIYYLFIRIGGLFYGSWKTKKSHTHLKIVETSWV